MMTTSEKARVLERLNAFSRSAFAFKLVFQPVMGFLLA